MPRKLSIAEFYGEKYVLLNRPIREGDFFSAGGIRLSEYKKISNKTTVSTRPTVILNWLIYPDKIRRKDNSDNYNNDNCDLCNWDEVAFLEIL